MRIFDWIWIGVCIAIDCCAVRYVDELYPAE